MAYAFPKQNPTPTRRRKPDGSGITSPIPAPSLSASLIHRKAACACGGGCPRCAAQSALPVSQPNDAAEIEADSTADKIMRMPAQAHSTPATATPTPHRNFLSLTSGQPLDKATRAFFEPRFGQDFSGVRVHTGAQAHESAQAVSALAFTFGRDMVFSHGQYAPETSAGRRLLAHELTHVVQQAKTPASFGNRVHRKEAKEKEKAELLEPNSDCGSGAPVSGNTAGDAAGLEVSPAKSGSPCACLMMVHNDEQNARKTAELIHANCAYNLALVKSSKETRCLKLPGHPKGENFDPNEFFAPGIIKECVNDEQSCRDFLTTKAGTKDRAEIDRFIQIKYFLAVSDCSKSFSLPVVVLHNNDLKDTSGYLAAKDAKGVTDLKMDVVKNAKADDKNKTKAENDKKTKDDDEIKTKPLEDKLKEKFGETIKNKLLTPGKTNIFRWCKSEELSRCHIGNPHEPDRVIWVTNVEDFKKLSKEDVNVVLQDDPSRVKEESKTDLSTMFLTLKTVGGEKFANLSTPLLQAIAANRKRMWEIIGEISGLIMSGAAEGSLANLRIIILRVMFDVLLQDANSEQLKFDELKREKNKFDNLHFINIETPIDKLKDQTDAERIKSYELIVTALKAVGLHCCGSKPAEAEDKVKKGLTLKPS